MKTKATRELSEFFEQSQLPASTRIELYMGRGRPRRDHTFDLWKSMEKDRTQPAQTDQPDQVAPAAVLAD